MTRHILEHTRRNGDELAAMRVELKGLAREAELRGLAQEVGGLAREVGSINAKLTALVRSLPAIIAEALRKDRSERRKKT